MQIVDPPQGFDGPDEWIELFGIPEIGKVETDRGWRRPRAVVETVEQEAHAPAKGRFNGMTITELFDKTTK